MEKNYYDEQNKKMTNYQGLWFYYDDDISIYWNRSKTFNVYSDGKEIDCFTDNNCKTMEQAQKSADEWLEEQLKEEMLDNADTN